ncbi:14481_t:CDS:2, partial [Acaulospora morrowiae]
RAGHTAVLIDNKIYFHGGVSDSGYIYSDLFYLDVSNPFNVSDISSMPWSDPTSIPAFTARSYGAACAGSITSKSIFFIGGTLSSGHFVDEFNTTTLRWNFPLVSGESVPQNRSQIQCVVLKDAIYVYSGNIENDMIKLNTTSLTWSVEDEINPPAAYGGYTATLLPNGNIVYLRGFYVANFTLPGLDQILVYNTNNNSWSTITATGSIPHPRNGHTAILLVQYDQILVVNGLITTTVSALNIVNYVWSDIPISTDVGAPSPSYTIVFQTSTLIGNYIFVALGYNLDRRISTNNIFLLDVSKKNNYKWVKTYYPPGYVSPNVTTTPNSEATNNIGVIIGGTIGGIVGLVVVVIIVLVIRKKYCFSASDSQGITNHQPYQGGMTNYQQYQDGTTNHQPYQGWRTNRQLYQDGTTNHQPMF